ncbi:MAG: hydrogenobyrinic acid a,c-diamide synthase (glutamine-hydrolyzing) [SAR324 cluster bacterium]|nr:hydrogenobyrinic acid a,c-diamide synthase (glutamine-hydrolyzing) [SAR324 cluster bacterium]
MEVTTPRLVISAPKKSSGKTTITLGLARALHNRGLAIAPFKKGPDYIDPIWQTMAAGQQSHNLDHHMMGEEMIKASFGLHSDGSDLALIEGNHGLHDGLDAATSTAGLALILKSPVILVVDAEGLNRSIAAQVLGQQAMEPDLPIAGVILNRVRSARQAEKLKASLKEFTTIPLLGCIPASEELKIPERHMGLTTAHESEFAEEIIQKMAEIIEENLDLDLLISLGQQAAALECSDLEYPVGNVRIKLGVFYDSAFCFYYPENLDALECAGAELRYINSMVDSSLPEVDALYIGGGFPESFLANFNPQLMSEVKAKGEAGLPIYAECGGMIYLSQSASWEGAVTNLVGLLPATVEFSKKPVGYGYMELVTTESKAWAKAGDSFKAHEFHYSKLVGQKGLEYIYDVKRGFGLGEQKDGVLMQNITASYGHLHALSSPNWAIDFTHWVASLKG